MEMAADVVEAFEEGVGWELRDHTSFSFGAVLVLWVELTEGCAVSVRESVADLVVGESAGHVSANVLGSECWGCESGQGECCSEDGFNQGR